MASVEKRNFSRGIFSPELEVRKDVDVWQAGARQLSNVLLTKFGGIKKRQGTKFVYEWPESNEARMFPFTFATQQSYAMLMGQASLRVIASVSGQAGVIVGPGYGITGISKANPGVVTAPYHGLSTGDQVFLSGESGMTEINDRTFTVTVIDADNFSIGIDTTGYSTWTGTNETVRTGAPPPPPPPPTVPPPPPSPPAPPTAPPDDPPGDGNPLP